MGKRAAVVHEYGGNDLWRRSADWDGLGVDHVRWRVADGAEGLTRRPDHLLFITLSCDGGHTTAAVEGERPVESADFPGATTFIPAGRARRTLYRDSTITYAALRLAPDLPEALGPLGDPARIEFIPHTNRPDPFLHQMAAALVERTAEGTGDGPADRLFADSVSTAVLLHLVRRYSGRAARRAAPPRPARLDGRTLRAVLDHIEDRLGENLRLDALAGVAGMDRYGFARAFRAATGLSPHRYVTERRLERAARLLRQRADLPIADIAYRVGLSSQSHLTTAFRRRYGATPARYRAGAPSLASRASPARR
ncbi:AraC family transcriptional regulator [Actinomadura sp. KC345]|uniref:helix-turn-helix domain-containing protein n=1 Tax=Actinomadura sp. KC345 TaxID=2530371 RepID=UPI001042B38A|nr:AraC family transcriptional regulator [Actinomadura sp. KC345]TDC52505.1 AraC family transcriptional regulator [Actinomadura sp. KC345]